MIMEDTSNNKILLEMFSTRSCFNRTLSIHLRNGLKSTRPVLSENAIEFTVQIQYQLADTASKNAFLGVQNWGF